MAVDAWDDDWRLRFCFGLKVCNGLGLVLITDLEERVVEEDWGVVAVELDNRVIRRIGGGKDDPENSNCWRECPKVAGLGMSLISRSAIERSWGH